MEIFAVEKLLLFVFFFIPGFISIKIWSFLVPREEQKTADYLLDAVSYSCVNFAFFVWLFIKILNQNYFISHPMLSGVGLFVTLFAMPILWPILFKRLLGWEKLRGHIIHPTPTSWDFFFGKGCRCFVLVHLKNGSLIGGICGEDSHASSYPYKQDIYMQEVWTVNDKGQFGEKIKGSMGTIIDKDYFDYVEFFEIEREVKDDGQQKQ